jgi:hypothetical protein
VGRKGIIVNPFLQAQYHRLGGCGTIGEEEELVMEEINHVIDEVLGIEEGGNQQHTILSSRRCVFQSKQPERGGLAWQWKPPKTVEPVKSVDLTLVLQSINPNLLGASQKTREHLTYLNQVLNQLRETMKYPMKCDMNVIYHYLLLMKRINYLFLSTNVRYRCFFTGEFISRHTIIEYLNTLLLLCSICYYKASLLNNDEVKVSLYQECYMMMSEVQECANYMMTERYVAAGHMKWSYKRSPRSLGNNIPMPSDTDEEDIRAIRQYLVVSLGGKSHIRMTALLTNAKSLESRIRCILAEVEQDLVTYNEDCYTSLAPLIETVKMYYTEIEEDTPDSVLKNYATDQIIYWKTQQQLILVRSDFACFKENNDTEKGKMALKRIQEIGDIQIEEGETAQALYNQISEEVSDCTDIELLPPIKAFPVPEPQKSFNDYIAEKWKSFDTTGTLKLALDHIRELSEKSQKESALLPPPLPSSNITTTPRFVKQEEEEDGEGGLQKNPIQLDNITKEAICGDRHQILSWLLKRETKKGFIVIEPNAVALLKENYDELQSVMKYNSLFNK